MNTTENMYYNGAVVAPVLLSLSLARSLVDVFGVVVVVAAVSAATVG